ncbi:universal stress protein [Hyphobacterium sp. HN65]|uniref:Universal stress protein n=1 Tax=Hyphobacterium lacteum TaxID=3116575 RepID=A0ABU7LQ35_9PROT|nr:universal stress protein [Hyphobacterium sp. HN65]MEE2525736.1 universal stress protein [Hyphobacterium sp. HN65]
MSGDDQRFRILLCIDGSEESHRGLRYAVRVGKGNDADITLLYVRRSDPTLSSGGMDLRIVRENVIDWGLDLPGAAALQDAHQQLIEMGFMNEHWKSKAVHKEAFGDPVGDNMQIYTSETGAQITLKNMVSPSVARGILDECELNEYELTIIAMADEETAGRQHINWDVTRTVVMNHTGTILVARGIEENHGHLICVTDDEKSIEAAARDAVMASRCECPVHLYSVAANEDGIEAAGDVIRQAREAIEAENVEIVDEAIEVGDPIERIIERGKNYSVIVMADSHVRGLRRFFEVSVAYRVLQHAHNSVMIIR